MNWHIRINGNGGLPFIWAHGLMGSIALDDATGYFYQRNLAGMTQYVRYDARGHGFTDATDNIEDYIWFNLANHMIAIADKLGAKHFIAGGQSMGSMTALYAARMVPDRVKALVLVILPARYRKQEKNRQKFTENRRN
jgi:pimeloyl-ACP methyl ester carboxylesterase